MVMSVTPILCITLAFWLGRGTVICENAEPAKQSTNSTANRETELRFSEFIDLLLVMGLAGIITGN
jgi:hypothetical protein